MYSSMIDEDNKKTNNSNAQPVAVIGCDVVVVDGAAVVFTIANKQQTKTCLLYTSPSPRDRTRSRMPSSA